jgi:uncharacterized protein DUF4953
MLGGINYEHVLGDQEAPIHIGADQERRALQALLATITPEVLTPSERLLAFMTPRPPYYDLTDESFSGDTGVAFDATRPAVEATKMTLTEILKPERLARLIEYHARNSELPGCKEVLSAVMSSTWLTERRTGF